MAQGLGTPGLQDAEEWISNLEDRVMEITQLEQKKEKRLLKNEDSLRDLWENIKHTNIHSIGIPEGEERDRKEQKTYLKK